MVMITVITVSDIDDDKHLLSTEIDAIYTVFQSSFELIFSTFSSQETYLVMSNSSKVTHLEISKGRNPNQSCLDPHLSLESFSPTYDLCLLANIYNTKAILFPFAQVHQNMLEIKRRN